MPIDKPASMTNGHEVCLKLLIVNRARVQQYWYHRNRKFICILSTFMLENAQNLISICTETTTAVDKAKFV